MKGLALPPYYTLVHSLGEYEKEVEILKQINEELKTKIKLLEEQLTYQRSSWIKKLFRR